MKEDQTGCNVCAIRVAYRNEMALTEPVVFSGDIDEFG
jgi:hypothetical protein